MWFLLTLDLFHFQLKVRIIMSSSERYEVGRAGRHDYDYGSIANLINNEVSFYVKRRNRHELLLC